MKLLHAYGCMPSVKKYMGIKARRTQTNNAQLYLAEPYSVHYQVA